MLKLASFSLVLAFSISSFAVSNDVRFFDLKSTTEDHPEKGTAVQVNISSQLMADPATDHQTPNEIWWHMDPAHPYVCLLYTSVKITINKTSFLIKLMAV